MDVEYNYINLVAIGNFNPAIINQNFLEKDCGFNFGELTDQSPPMIPVIKDLSFENMSININLERLELKEKNVEENLETKVIETFKSIYSVLPFTPINAIGVNINCKLKFDSEEAQSLKETISSPESYREFLKVEQLQVSESYGYMKENKTWLSSNIVIDEVNELTRRIDTYLDKDFINLNYNNEANNLKENKINREYKLNKLFKEYEKFRKEFLDFIEYLRK